MVTSLLNRAKLSLLSPRLDATWRYMGKVCILIKLWFMITSLFVDTLKKKKSLWKRFFYFTSAVDSQPISWLSVWGIAYFLVGSSRALWKALMKSAATEKSATDDVLNQILAMSQLPTADVFCSHVIKGTVGRELTVFFNHFGWLLCHGFVRQDMHWDDRRRGHISWERNNK